MKTVIWVVLLVLFSKGRTFNVISSNVNSTRPQVVNIGALVCFNSSIGKVAKVAINTAVEDVNSNPAILKGTKLKVTMQDTKTSHFLGIIEGMYSLTLTYIHNFSSTHTHTHMYLAFFQTN